MKRFVSLDIMRGTAIFLMVIFHVPMVWYDRRWLEAGPGVEVHPLGLVMILCMVFFGAWAGFFLMVSAASNMISMQRNLDSGKGPWKVVVYQVVGGSMLLVAAFLVESVLGYHGYLGGLVVGDNRWDMLLWRGFHMETIHTIALCVIINGAVMGVLSSRGGHRRTVRNVKALLLLSVLVVLLTPLVYNGARWAYPGYPFAEQWSELVGRWLPIQYPVLGETTLLELFIKTVLAFAAGQPEPLFPYLALSFLGSAMGLLLYDRRYSNAIPVVGGTIGAALFIVGALGLGVTFITGRADLHGLADHFYELPGLYPALWLWWFLLLSGSFLLTFVLIIRLVEIRGISTQVGKHTLFLRRYGFVAFSVYTFQSIYVLPRLVLDIFPGIRSSSPFPTRMGLVPVMAMVPMTVVIWEVLLRCWQRIDFTFGLEWFLAKASEVLIPSKKVRQNGGPRRAWLRTARLDPVAYLTAPEWSDLKTDEDTSEAQRNDSRLSLVLSSLCIIVPLLLPISIPLALSSFKEDDKNPVNIAALLLGLFSAISWSVILLVLVFAPKVTV